MAHEAARIPDIVRNIDQFQRVEQGEGCGPIAHVQREDGPGGDHLRLRQFMAWVAWQPRVQDLGYAAFHELAQFHCILALPARAQVERFQPLVHDPGIEG